MFEFGPTPNAAMGGTVYPALSSKYAARDDATARRAPAHCPDRLRIAVMPYIVHAGTPADALRYMRMLRATRIPLALRTLRNSITPN